MSLVAGLLNQTIDEIYSITTSGSGDTSRTSEYKSVPCRWQRKTTQMFNPNSEPVTIKVQVWLLPEYTVEEDYEIEKDSKIYRVVAVDEMRDLSGELDHWKVYLE